MVSKWAITITTYKWDINWGYIPLTNLLLASWDIQVFMEIMFFFSGGESTLPPIIMVQWKMGVSPILVSFHFG